MAKKINRSTQKTTVVSAPDLEEKRKNFQQAAEKKKSTTDIKTGPKVHSPRRRTAIIIIGALFLMIGSSAVAYTYYYWNNSPEKIVIDAVSNAASAPSATFDASLTTKGASLLRVDGRYGDGKSSATGVATADIGGKATNIDMSLVWTPRDMYIKVSNATALTRGAIPVSQQPIFDMISPLLARQIDNQWIQMATSDVALFEPATKVSACSAVVAKTMTTDTSLRTEVVRLYANHPFFVVTPGNGSGDVRTYSLQIDSKKLGEFIDAARNSKISSVLSACDKEISMLRSDAVNKMTVQLTIVTSTRTITNVQVFANNADKVSVEITPLFTQEVTIDEPKAAVKLNDIKTVVFEAFEKLQSL